MNHERLVKKDTIDEIEDPTLVEDNEVTKYYKITARNQGQMNMLDKLFDLIQYLSRIGASRNINLFVDGDGAIMIKFKSCKEGESVFRELDSEAIHEAGCGYGYEKIDLNSGADDAIIIDLG